MAPIAAPMPANAAASSGSVDIVALAAIAAEMDEMMAAISTITNGVFKLTSLVESSAKNRSGFVRTFVILIIYSSY